MTAPPNTDRSATRIAARRVCAAVAAVALGGVAWTAAHDILTGAQDVTAEWTLIVFMALLCGCSLMGWLMRSSAPPGRGGSR